MKKIQINKEAACGGLPPYNLISVEDAFDWSSGKRGDRTGTYYTILRVSDMEKQRIFVRDAAPAADLAAVQQAAAALAFIQVDFDNVTSHAYVDKTGSIRIIAEAEAVRLVPRKGAYV